MERGVSIKAGGETITLRFSFGGLCHYEDLTEKPLIEGLQELQAAGEKVRFASLIPVIQAALYHSHPDLDRAGVMAMQFDDLKSLIGAISKAAELAFPEEDEDKSGNAKATGQKPKAVA